MWQINVIYAELGGFSSFKGVIKNHQHRFWLDGAGGSFEPGLITPLGRDS
jgi:hypothetical protein